MNSTSVSVLAGLLLLASLQGSSQERSGKLEQIHPGVVVVKVKQQAGELMLGQGASGIPSLDARLARWGATRVEKMFRHKPIPPNSGIPDLSRILRVQIPSALNPLVVARDLERDPLLEYAEPVPKAHFLAIPNDSLYPLQQHLPQILAASAWDVQKGDSGVIIAFVDTGTDLDHEDLRATVWVNTAEASGASGFDDDANGFIDDIHGWDFGDDDPDPSPPPSDIPSFGHGTHCTGIACAETDNGRGIAGVSWNCTHMPLKVSSDDDSRFAGYEAIVYAADNGADVISNSWVSFFPVAWEQDVITYAHMKGALVVCAAGNDGVEVANPPAVYRHAISVAAVSVNDARTFYSTYGPWVDIAAPGGDQAGWILSAVPGNGYEGWAGTSMATPVVAGVCGLLRSLHPGWTNDQILTQLVATADNIDATNPSFRGLLGQGRVNAYRALTEVNPAVPDARMAMMRFSVDDASAGNGDGILERGETFSLRFEVRNFSVGGTDAGATELLCLRPGLEVLDVTVGPLVFLPDSELIITHSLRVADTAAPGMYNLKFTVRSGYGYARDEEITLPVGKTPVLLVDNDYGSIPILPQEDSFYRAALDRQSILFNHWNAEMLGWPGATVLREFPIVVSLWPWGMLDEGECRSFISYLDSGGSLFASGQDLGWALWNGLGTDSSRAFMRDYLHAELIANHSGSSTVRGVLADPVSHDLNFMIWQPGTPGEWQSPDVISAAPGAEPIFTYHDGRTAAIRYDGEHRVVYAGFGLESVDANENTPIGSASAIRDELLLRIVEWLNVIEHDPRRGVSQGASTLTIEARLRGTIPDFSSLTLFWRNAGETDYQAVVMTEMGERRYSASVQPAEPNGSIEYYLETVHPYYRWRSPTRAPDTSHAYPVPVQLVVDTREMDFGPLPDEVEVRDSSFLVWNLGGTEDSISVSLVYVNVSPESALTVSPTTFLLAPDSLQPITITIRPSLLSPVTYAALVMVDSWRSSPPTQFSKTLKFRVVSGVEEERRPPRTYSLHQNYPNPFNPRTVIEYAIPRACSVTLGVYNTVGQEVSRLVSAVQAPGVYRAEWDAADMPSGVYFYRLRAGGFVQTKKALLMR